MTELLAILEGEFPGIRLGTQGAQAQEVLEQSRMGKYQSEVAWGTGRDEDGSDTEYCVRLRSA